jgi:UDP-glucose 6-dehydrogenase
MSDNNEEQFDMENLDDTELKFTVGLVGDNAITDYLKFAFTRPRNEIVQVAGTVDIEDLIEAGPHIVFVATEVNRNEDGIVEASELEDHVLRVLARTNAGIVIKTSLPIELVDRLCSKNKRIVYNPDMITESGTALEKANVPAQILGGHPSATMALQEIYFRFTQLKIHSFGHVSAVEAALIEHGIAAALAMKAIFYNQLYDVCQDFEAGYINVSGYIGQDPRFGSSMSFVPTLKLNRGYDNQRMIDATKDLVKFNDRFTLLKECDIMNDAYQAQTKE